jgi:hypothetical protein
MTFPVLSANGPSGYKLTRSLRFRSSASAYLNRTPSVAGNQQRFTWSGWVKLGALVDETFVSLGTTLGVNLRFSSYALQSNILTVGSTTSTSVYRDPSAWYHIVLAVDTTQASNNNRLRLYVNGNEVTYSANATITQNANLGANTTTLHALGVEARPGSATAGTYFDGYMAEVNFVDGQALTPSSFGSTNATTGVWQPAAYTGTYGTNGFYLPFTDNSALTTASNAGLGKDFSGNANYWVTNNISITTGVTYDSMTDVPTLTSATAANYATWNGVAVGTDSTLSSGNLDISSGNATPYLATAATIGMQSGQWYWEITITASSGSPVICVIGISTKSSPNEIGLYPGQNANGWGYYGATGNKYNNATSSAYGATFATNDVIGVAFDATAGTLVFYKNNTSQGTAFSSLTNGPYLPAIGDSSGGATFSASANFGQRPFTYTPPSGFVALNTYNLPASTVPNGASYMAATLYTGNGYPTAGTQTIANTVGSVAFQPDFVWIKRRDASSSHTLTDSVRGVNSQLFSNLTAAQETNTDHVTAFTSSGFSLGSGTSGTYPSTNNNGGTYVGWQWKGGGTAVSNTSGSITSSVSANTTSGFSVATYTGTGVAGTIGHGLGVAPSMIIVKSRSAVGAWPVYHTSLGNGSNLVLNTTAATATSSTIWNATSPTSSVFSVGINTDSNTVTVTYVAYCFAAIKGFSAFGSYTGNGSTDGPFVYLGFRPRYVMFKRTDVACDWYTIDTSRATYNVINPYLLPNKANVEATDLSWDILSNGFKLRTTYGDVNGSGANIVYAAFAENPFQNALAR